MGKSTKGRRGAMVALLAGGVSIPAVIAGQAWAGDLRGTVTDANTQGRLQGAHVRIQELGRTAVSTSDGAFSFLALPAGDYTVVADFVGYDSIRERVRIEDTGVLQLSLTIGSGDEVEVVIVTGSRAAQAEALQVKRSATVILDAVSADDVGKLPDNNAADALQRLPGVTATIDQGEGRYVVVRGIDANLVNVTLNGQIFPGPEGASRQVALDTFPSDIISRLEVIKAQTPDLDANAVGGTVNIVTASAFDSPNGFRRLSGRVGYNELSDTLNFAGVGSYAALFGPADQFGVVLAASYSERDYDTHNYGADAQRLVGPGTILTSNRVLRYYQIVRERTGVIANFEWRPSDALRLYANNTYARYSDDEQRDETNYEYALGTLSGASPDFRTGRYSGGRAAVELRDRKVIQRIYNSSLGGSYEIGQLRFDGNVTFALAEEDTPKRIDYEFRSATTAFPNTYDATGLFLKIDAPLLGDATRYPFRRVRSRVDDVTEEVVAVTGDVRYDFAARPGYLKAGLRHVSRDKSWDRTNNDFSGITGTFLLSDVAGVGPTDLLGDNFSFGPVIDRDLIRAYLEANRGRLIFDANGSLSNSLVTDFDATETVTAGYGMGEFTLGGLIVTAGVRVERTEADYESFNIQRTGGRITGSPRRRGEAEYTHVLPDVLARYDVGDSLVLRAAYTNTIGRPNYSDLVPRRDIESAEVSPGNFQGAYSEGNPDLEPFESQNLDASMELYLRPAGIVSVGVFYKKVENPVFTRTINQVNVEFEGRQFSRLNVTRPENAEGGSLLGIEFNYQQQFNFLPSPFDGFGVSANYTAISSDTEVVGRTDEIPFFRQSDELANAAIYYEKSGFEGRLAVTYRSPYLTAIVRPDFDVYVDERTQLDLRLSYNLTDQLQVSADLLNITGETLRVYQGSPDRVFADERYSYSANLGFSLRF